jgi:hypothetical protein
MALITLANTPRPRTIEPVLKAVSRQLDLSDIIACQGGRRNPLLMMYSLRGYGVSQKGAVVNLDELLVKTDWLP